MAVKRNDNELEKSLKPLMTIGRFMGITFSAKTLSKRYKLILAYRVLIFSGMILLVIHEIPTMTFWTRFAKGIHRMLAFLETRLRWVTVVANFVLNSLANQSINQVLVILNGTKLPLNRRDRREIVAFQLILVFFHFFFLVPYMYLGIDCLWLNPHRTWYTSIIYIGTEFFTGISIIFFVTILHGIKKYFQLLNGSLGKGRFELIRDNRTMRIKNSIFYVAAVARRREDEVGKIVRFRQIHMTLIECCLRTNECFSLQVLLFILLALIEMIYSFRSAVIFFIDPNNNDVNFWRSKYWLESALILFWGGYYFWQIFSLIAACEAIVLEAVNTARIVNELINKEHDIELKKQLQIFSLQLINHQIYLYAGKFVVLNYPLLNSIVGTVITYLVIISTVKGQ